LHRENPGFESGLPPGCGAIRYWKRGEYMGKLIGVVLEGYTGAVAIWLEGRLIPDCQLRTVRLPPGQSLTLSVIG